MIAIIGLYEVIIDYGILKMLGKTLRTILRSFAVWLIYLMFSFITITTPDSPFNIVLLGLAWIAVVAFAVFFLYDVVESTGGKYITYPLVVVGDIFRGFGEFFSIKPENLVRVDGHAPMEKQELSFYSVAYVLTILIHLGAIFYTANIFIVYLKV